MSPGGPVMKNSVLFFAMMVVILAGILPAYAEKTRHVYNAGIVSSFGNNQITIGNGTYTLRPEVTVVLVEKDGKGAHYQRKGRLSDVSVGKNVHLKSRGVMVYEIVVER